MKQFKIMESHSEQHFNDLAKKVYKSAPLETPSIDFTSKVMANLENETVIAYKPLISRIGWIAIIAMLVGISVYLYSTGTGESTLLNSIDFSVLSNNQITNLIPEITFSKTLMYCVVCFGAFWFFQVKMINQFVEKRLEF